jgi:hypothetical protein
MKISRVGQNIGQENILREINIVTVGGFKNKRPLDHK